VKWTSHVVENENAHANQIKWIRDMHFAAISMSFEESSLVGLNLEKQLRILVKLMMAFSSAFCRGITTQTHREPITSKQQALR
jgi:hypothetical protein